jgi:2-polyprenyl-3-methyl-5-hydroxy-6-metoxy-1,4-benzoquinol methylase
MADRMGESWDDVHAGRDPAKVVEPHPAVVDTVRGLAVGTALDVGCGDGVNLVWLAAQGWDVTGVDASSVGLERAAARAESAGVADRVRLEQADLATWTPAAAFDLVLEVLVHAPDDLARSSVRARAAGGVAPGGTLLVVTHRTVAPWVASHHHVHGGELPTAGEIAAELGLDGSGWRLVRAAELERAERHGDEVAAVVDAVVQAVRSER